MRTLKIILSVSFALAAGPASALNFVDACEIALRGMTPKFYSNYQAKKRADYRRARRALASGYNNTRIRRERLLRGQAINETLKFDASDSIDGLKILPVMKEQMKPYISTPFGMARVEYILRTGFEGEELRKRLDVVEFLIANPGVHKIIRDQLRTIRESTAGKESSLMKMLERDRTIRKTSISQMGLSGAHWGFLGTGESMTLMLPGPIHHVGLLLGLIASKAAGASGNFSQTVRNELNQFQSFINLAHTLALPLKGTQVENLVAIGDHLDGLDDKAIDENMARLSGCYDRMLDVRVRRFLKHIGMPWEPAVQICSQSVDSLLGFTAFTLPKMRSLFEVSKSSVIGMIGTVADLDVYSAIAEFVLENQDRYFKPLIIESPTPYFKMESTYHPYVLHSAMERPMPHSIELSSENPFMLLEDPSRPGAGNFLKTPPAIIALARAGFYVPGRVTMSIFKQLYKFHKPGLTLAGRAALDEQVAAVNSILDSSADGKPCMIAMDKLVEHVGDTKGFPLSQAVLKIIAERRPNCIGLIATNYTALAANPPQGVRVANISNNPDSPELVEGHTGFDFEGALQEDKLNPEVMAAFQSFQRP